MTTIERVILTCPSCDREGLYFSTHSYNNIGWRQWSDGWGAGTYGSTRNGLLHCLLCDMVFPEAGCECRHHTENNSSPKLIGREQISDVGSKLDSELRVDPTKFSSLADSYWEGRSYGCSAREALGTNRWLGDGTEKLLRLQWWWDWNALSRQAAPTLVQALASDVPAREPIPADLVENLERLLPMLSPGDPLLAGEVLRRLSRFEEALFRYEADEAALPIWRTGLIALARQHKAGLVELAASD